MFWAMAATTARTNRMVPLKARLFWQKAAQRDFARVLPFETAAWMAHLGFKVAAQHPATRLGPDCYPSLYLGPDLSWVGPAFRTGCAEPCQAQKSPFANPVRTADSGRAIILQRGSSTCINLSVLWHFFPHSLCRPARKAASTPTVRRWVPLAAQPLVRPPTTIWRKAPSRAACWALSRAIRAIAADTARAALTRGTLTSKVIRAPVRMAFLFAPTPAAAFAPERRVTCFKKS